MPAIQDVLYVSRRSLRTKLQWLHRVCRGWSSSIPVIHKLMQMWSWR